MKKLITLLVLIPTFCFGQWVQIGNDIDGEAAGDACGYSTAISSDGSIVAIGANFNQGNGSGAGHVRIFENSGGIWTQIGSDIDGDPGDQTGQYVSLSADGSIVAVGEPISAVNGSASGQVRVFENVNGVWTQIGSNINGDSFNWQTRSVSLSDDGSLLAVGSRGADVSGIGAFTGKVRVYENQGGNWVQIGNDISGFGLNDFFGISVSLSSDGSTVAVGAIGDIFNSDTGYVSVFKYIGGTWIQIGSNINGTSPGGEFGNSVSLSADGLVVATGERFDISGKGLTQVYKNIGGNWTQIGSNILGENVDDQFGWSVALSDSGNILVSGARRNDGNGIDAGRTYIFENQGGNWVLINSAIDGEAVGDQAGFSVCISANGSIIATGAVQNDGNGNNSGHVRIYENNSVLSINEFENDREVRFFPNPTTNFIQINSEFEILSFEITSITGMTIKQEVVNNQKQLQISMSDLSQGVYLIRLNCEYSMPIIKIIKQ